MASLLCQTTSGLLPMMNLTSYRAALLCYCLFFLLLIFPYWGRGEVIAPHRQSAEVALLVPLDDWQIENHKFNDFSNGFIPELLTQHRGARSGWLALWQNQNEVGRPVYQIGFSPAYLPSWIIARITTNPWRLITVTSLYTCCLVGIFVMLFCREIGLRPLAGLIAGSSLATSPALMYWLTFPMFSSTWCWAAGALLGITRMARKSDLVAWSILTFSVYSLLMTGYPQSALWHAYILTGFTLHLVFRKRREGWLRVGQFLALAASAILIGLALALPVYLDVVHLWNESARVVPDPAFFTAILPKLDTAFSALRFFVLRTTPEIFGNPIRPRYPFPYDGISLTPLVVFFASLGVLFTSRKTWGWWLAIVVSCLFAFIHPLYVLGVHYLGFNLSRSSPFGCIMLPLTIIVAHGADALVKRSVPGEGARVVIIATASVLVVIAVGVVFGIQRTLAIRWDMVLAMLALVVCFVAQSRKTRPLLLIAALLTVMATISYPLMLHHPPTQIATTSPLVEKVRANLPAGSRFAVATPGVSVFPPNLNVSLGLASAHTYNSLSSRHYHVLIQALGGEVHTYGRSNRAIAPDYNSLFFWMSNISVILSATKLVHENLAYLGEESGIHLYQVISRMGDSLQIRSPSSSPVIAGPQIIDPRLLPSSSPAKRLDLGDVLEFEVNRGAPSVLIVSQKFHRDWQARVFDQSGWAPAQTTVINGVFQGVLLPQDVQRVRLEFKPYARYAWIAHLVWLFLLIILGRETWRRKKQVSSPRASQT